MAVLNGRAPLSRQAGTTDLRIDEQASLPAQVDTQGRQPPARGRRRGSNELEDVHTVQHDTKRSVRTVIQREAHAVAVFLGGHPGTRAEAVEIGLARDRHGRAVEEEADFQIVGLRAFPRARVVVAKSLKCGCARDAGPSVAGCARQGFTPPPKMWENSHIRER